MKLKVIVLFSIIWLGGILCLGVLIFFHPEPTNGSELRYLNEIFHRIDMTHVATTPIVALITGLILCWKTKWGFFRYKWVIVKLVLSFTIVIFSIIYLAPVAPKLIEISENLGLRALKDKTYQDYFMRAVIFNPVNIFLMLFMTYLSYFKPWGKRK